MKEHKKSEVEVDENQLIVEYRKLARIRDLDQPVSQMIFVEHT